MELWDLGVGSSLLLCMALSSAETGAALLETLFRL